MNPNVFLTKMNPNVVILDIEHDRKTSMYMVQTYFYGFSF